MGSDSELKITEYCRERYRTTRSLQSSPEHVWPEQLVTRAFSDPEIPLLRLLIFALAALLALLKVWGLGHFGLLRAACNLASGIELFVAEMFAL